jgi:RNA recognition motif-containing protein
MPGKNKKNTLYVGGLEASVTEEILFAAFIPFGDIKEVSMPMDFTVNKHKGFAFIEYVEEEDATEAIDNMVKYVYLFHCVCIFRFLFSFISWGGKIFIVWTSGRCRVIR